MQTEATLAFCAFALLAVQPATSDLQFLPEESSRIERRFVYTNEVALDGFSVEVDGEDMTAMIGDIGMEIETVSTYVVTDEFLKVGDERVLELQRTFDELGAETQIQVDAAVASDSSEATTSSELVDSVVLFTWDEDLEDYVASTEEEGDVDQDILDGLDMNMDMSGLLPPDEVEEGDQWEVELSSLSGLILPGGNLALKPDQEMPEVPGFDPEVFNDMMAEYQERSLEMLEEWVDGGIDATYTGTREVDGRELAVITLAVDFSVDADLASIGQSAIDAVLEQLELPVAVDVSIDEAHVTGDTSGEGELLWDVEGGFGRSMTLSIDYEMAMDIAISADADGESHSFGGEFEFSGIGDAKVTAE